MSTNLDTGRSRSDLPRYMRSKSVILVTGGSGLVGGATARLARQRDYTAVLAPSRAELDLADAGNVNEYFATHQPEFVFMCAAKVGGIQANLSDPVGFAVDNLKIELNLFEACLRHNVRKVMFLGSSCIYPRAALQPMREDALMTGPLEPTNESYALAKLVGVQLAKAYRQQYGLVTISPMPCNVYGTGDHFDLSRAHVLSALVRRFVDAVDESQLQVTLWGTGSARREFMHVDDLADALLFLMQSYDSAEILNVGTGEDVSIRELAEMVARATGFAGEIAWDTTRPDGMPRKCLDVSRLATAGFKAKIPLEEGIRRTVAEYRTLKSEGRMP